MGVQLQPAILMHFPDGEVGPSFTQTSQCPQILESIHIIPGYAEALRSGDDKSQSANDTAARASSFFIGVLLGWSDPEFAKLLAFDVLITAESLYGLDEQRPAVRIAEKVTDVVMISAFSSELGCAMGHLMNERRLPDQEALWDSDDDLSTFLLASDTRAIGGRDVASVRPIADVAVEGSWSVPEDLGALLHVPVSDHDVDRILGARRCRDGFRLVHGQSCAPGSGKEASKKRPIRHGSIVERVAERRQVSHATRQEIA